MSAANAAGTNQRASRIADVTFCPRQPGDCVPDELLEEIVRRIRVSFRQQGSGDVIYSKTPPDDKTKIWQPVNNDNLPIGGTQYYDAESAQWVPSNGNQQQPESSSNIDSKSVAFQMNSDPTQSYTFNHGYEGAEFPVIVTPRQGAAFKHSVSLNEANQSVTISFSEVSHQDEDNPGSALITVFKI